MDSLPVLLLTHFGEIFSITDVIIFMTGIGLLGMGVLLAYVFSREK
jgi:hypothetical protein